MNLLENLYSNVHSQRAKRMYQKSYQRSSSRNIIDMQSQTNDQSKISKLSNKSAPIKQEINKLVLTFKELNMKLNTMDISKIIELFSKHPITRSPEDIQLIMNFLLKTKLKEILKENLITEFNVSLSLFNISKNIEYQILKKNEIIHNIIEYVENKYFVVLQGNFSLLCLEEKLQDFNLEEFFKYLTEFKKKNQDYIITYLQKINENYLVFDFFNPEKYKEYFFIKKLRSLITNKKNGFYFTALFKEFYKTEEENTYNVDLKEIEKLDPTNSKGPIDQNNTTFNINYIRYLKQLEKLEFFKPEIFTSFLNESEIEFLEKCNLDEKFLFRVYKVNIHKIFTSNDYIEQVDFALEDSKNLGLIVCDEDANLAVIKKDVYQEHILSEKSRVKMKNMHYIYDLLFGKFLNKQIFEKKYFDHFIYEEINKGEILFKENQQLEYVYLIVEGNLDLFVKKNILAVNDDLMNFINLHEEFQNLYKNSEVTQVLNSFRSFTKTFFDSGKDKPSLSYFQKLDDEEKLKSKTIKKKKTFDSKENKRKESISPQNIRNFNNKHQENKKSNESYNLEKNKINLNNSPMKNELELEISSPINKHNFSNTMNLNLANFNTLDVEKQGLFEELKKVKEFCLKRISNNEILGIEDFIYNKHSYFKAIVVSNKLSYFKIDTNIMRKMLCTEKHAENIFYEFSNNKIFSLIRRLFELIKNLNYIKNTREINKNRYSVNQRSRINILIKDSSSFSNLNPNKHAYQNKSTNEISNNNYNGYFNNSRGILKEENKRQFYSPDNRRSKDLLNLYDNTFNNNKLLNNSDNFKDKSSSDNKFVLNSLKEFNSSSPIKKRGTSHNFECANINNNLIKRLNHYSDSNTIDLNNSYSSRVSPLNKNIKKEKNSFSDFFKENDNNRNEPIKLETIHEQFDNTAYNNNMNENKKKDIFPKIANHNNNLTSKIKYNHNNIVASKHEKNSNIINTSNNNMSYLEIASFYENKYNKQKNVKDRKIRIKKFTSQNYFDDYFKNYDNSYSEKSKNDQMLYLIRKNINEIKLNNPLLGGGIKKDKKLNYKKKDYFLKKSLDFDNNNLNKHNAFISNNPDNLENKNRKRKSNVNKNISKISQEFTKNYSFDYGNIHKNYNFLNLKNLNNENSVIAGLQKIDKIKRNNTLGYNYCLTEDGSNQKYYKSNLNNNLIKSNKNLRNNLIQEQQFENNGAFYSNLNTIDDVNRNYNTDISHNLSFDSNKFDFEDEYKNKNNIGINSDIFELNYLNTAPEKYDYFSEYNKNTNLPYLSLVLNTNETLNTPSNLNTINTKGTIKSSNNNRDNKSEKINIEMNFVLQTSENLDKKQNNIKEPLNTKGTDKDVMSYNSLDETNNFKKKGASEKNKESENNVITESEKEIVSNITRHHISRKNNQEIDIKEKILIEYNNNKKNYRKLDISKISSLSNIDNINSNSRNKVNNQRSPNSQSLNKRKDLTLNLNNISNEKLYISGNYKKSEKFSEKNNKNNFNDQHKRHEINDKKILENLEDSKIETKSFFSNKLFSENSFDEGIREQILTSKSFFINTDKLNFNNIKEQDNNNKERKLYEKFKNQTNNFTFMKSDYKYPPIQKSIEAKRLKYLKNHTKKFLESIKLNPVEYNISDGDVLLKYNLKEKDLLKKYGNEIFIIENNTNEDPSSNFDKRIKSGNNKEILLENIDISKINPKEKTENNNGLNTNVNLIYNNKIPNTYLIQQPKLLNSRLNSNNENNSNLRSRSMNSLNEVKIVSSKITNINYDFMKEYRYDKAESLKDNYFFENYIKRQKESIQQTKEFLDNLKIESQKNLQNQHYNPKINPENARDKNTFNKNSNNLIPTNFNNKFIDRNNNIFSPISLNSLNSNILFNNNFKNNLKSNGAERLSLNRGIVENTFKYMNTDLAMGVDDNNNFKSEFNKNSFIMNNYKLEPQYKKQNLFIKSPSNIDKLDIQLKLQAKEEDYLTEDILLDNKINDKEFEIKSISQKPITPFMLNNNKPGLKNIDFSKIKLNYYPSSKIYDVNNEKNNNNNNDNISANNVENNIYKNNINKNRDCDSLLKGIGSFILSPLNNNNKVVLSENSNFNKYAQNNPRGSIIQINRNIITQNEKSTNKPADFISNDGSLKNLKNMFNPEDLNKKSINDIKNVDFDLLTSKQKLNNINLNLDVYPRNEIFEKLQRLKLFPKMAEKYSFKNEEFMIEKLKNYNNKNIFKNAGFMLLQQSLNEQKKNIDYDIFKDIENPEIIHNAIKSPRIRKLRTNGNELLNKSSPVGKFFSKIKKY